MQSSSQERHNHLVPWQTQHGFGGSVFGMTKTACCEMLDAVPCLKEAARCRPSNLSQPADYRFITHQFQYCGGVAAEPASAPSARASRDPCRWPKASRRSKPTSAGSELADRFLASDLRSPGQFTDAGFVAFNRHYVERLAAWGIFHDEVNPVARSDVCLEIAPPATPSFYGHTPNDTL